MNIMKGHISVRENKNFKQHPFRKGLYIKNDGTEIYENESQKIIIDKIDKNTLNISKLIYLGRSYLSVPKLILETYGPPKPNDGKRYYTQFKDDNNENIHPSNLKWSTTTRRTIGKRRDAYKKSKLSIRQSREAYIAHIEKDVPLSVLSKLFDTSDMAIFRAIKRYKKDFIDKKDNGVDLLSFLKERNEK